MTGNELFRTITEKILDYVVREMLDPEGGFYSTQDADSEGEEGKNILEFVGDMDQRPALAEARRKLFAAREQRVQLGSISAVPLLQDRRVMDRQATAYVCDAPAPGRALSAATGFACHAPATEPEALRTELEQP